VPHAATSAVAVVAASLLSVSELASSVVLASGIVALPEAVPAVAVVPVPAPALEPVAVVPVLAPALEPVPPDVAPVVAVPEDAGVLLLLQAVAKNPAVTPNPNTFMNFILSPSK
jgi:hypothetical protein